MVIRSKIYSPRTKFGGDYGSITLTRNFGTVKNIKSTTSNGKRQRPVLQVPPSVGHKTEDCFNLKNNMQDAMEKELLDKDAGLSGILKDPFPKHSEGQASFINVIEMGAPIDD